MQYSIWDPTGNITALVEDKVEIDRQPAIASCIMQRHPEVEQVGFVCTLDASNGHAVVAELRMAGGEFCGNASMSASAWYVERCCCEEEKPEGFEVLLKVSGAVVPVITHVGPAVGGVRKTSITMPGALSIETKRLDVEGANCELPVVHFEGISHVIIRDTSPAYELCRTAKLAESCARAWCSLLEEDGLGLMFLRGDGSKHVLKPLVYIPAGDTMFWENSCASGSAAVGIYLAHEAGTEIRLELEEPGGVLCVSADEQGRATLNGSARYVSSHNLL